MPYITKIILLAIVPILIGITPSVADNLCDAVLTSRSFDIYETTITDNVATRAIDDVCNTRWSSKDDFVNRVRKWDSGFSYIDIFKGTGNADLSSQGRTVDQDYQQFCQNADRSFLRDFFTKRRAQIASTAVAAWESCIKTTQQVGLFSRAIVAENRTLVTIAVRFVPSGVGDKLKLVDYDHTRYSCSILGKDVKNIVLADEGLGNSVDISCFPKDSQAELHIAINTSQNQTIGPFIIPSKAYLDLQSSITALQDRVDELMDSLKAEKESVQQLTSRLAVNVPGYTSDAALYGNFNSDKWIELKCPDGQFMIGYALDSSAPFIVSAGRPENKARSPEAMRVLCGSK